MALTVGNALSPRTHPGMAVRSSAALQAQLAQYQKQLSDCVNCGSSSTSEGKAQIQALNTRIQALQAQLGDIASAKAAQQASRVSQVPAAGAAADAGTQSGSSGAGSGSNGDRPSPPGRLLDVYA